MRWKSHLSSFLALLTSNWISLAGAALTTTAFLGMVFSFLLLSLGSWSGPYAGLGVFLVLPGLFVGGLALVPLRLFLHRKSLKERILARRETPVHILKTVGILTAVNLGVLASAGYEGLHYMDSVEFCGTLCHTVMRPQYEAYLSSPHARVSCVECHIGPGASWFVKSKLSGLRQVFAVLFRTYQKPIPTPVGIHWHVFHDPSEETDRSISIGKISRKLPFIKAVALETFKKSGPGRTTGKESPVSWRSTTPRRSPSPKSPWPWSG